MLFEPYMKEGGTEKENADMIVKQIIRKEFRDELLSITREEIPEVYSSMVGRRDEYMANSILEAMESEDSSCLVGVVGLAHLSGIEQILKEKGDYSLV
jgi:pheromone shutdown protein TraB